MKRVTYCGLVTTSLGSILQGIDTTAGPDRPTSETEQLELIARHAREHGPLSSYEINCIASHFRLDSRLIRAWVASLHTLESR